MAKDLASGGLKEDTSTAIVRSLAALRRLGMTVFERPVVLRNSNRRAHPGQPLPVNLGRDFGGFDLASATPENIGVGNGDSAGLEMAIDCRLVLE